MSIIKVLWGVKDNDPTYYEQVLSTNHLNFEDVIKVAKKDGFHSFRVGEYENNEKPDFIKTIN